MRKLLLNKKGNFSDIPQVMMTVFVVGFALMIVLLFLNNFNSNIQNNDAIPNITKEGVNVYYTILETNSDFIIPLIFVGFLAFSVFSARLIPSSPKFFIIGVLATIFLPFVAMMIVNIWDGFITNATVAQQSAGLIFTPFLLNNLVFATLIYSIAVNIALFSKEDTK